MAAWAGRLRRQSSSAWRSRWRINTRAGGPERTHSHFGNSDTLSSAQRRSRLLVLITLSSLPHSLCSSCSVSGAWSVRLDLQSVRVACWGSSGACFWPAGRVCVMSSPHSSSEVGGSQPAAGPATVSAAPVLPMAPTATAGASAGAQAGGAPSAAGAGFGMPAAASPVSTLPTLSTTGNTNESQEAPAANDVQVGGAPSLSTQGTAAAPIAPSGDSSTSRVDSSLHLSAGRGGAPDYCLSVNAWYAPFFAWGRECGAPSRVPHSRPGRFCLLPAASKVLCPV